MFYRLSTIGVFVVIALFTYGAWLMFTGEVRDIVRGFASKSWPSTQGVVLSSRISSHPGSHASWFPVVTFQYTVDDRAFEGDVIAFHSLSGPRVGGNNRADVQEMADSYAAGTTVEVYYDPQDPAVSVLQPGASYTNIFGPVFSLIVLVIGVSILRLFKRSKSDRRLAEVWIGKQRACPKCGTCFVSVQDKGGCPQCGHTFYASDSLANQQK